MKNNNFEPLTMSLQDFKSKGLDKKMNTKGKSKRPSSEKDIGQIASQSSSSNRHGKYNAVKTYVDGIKFDSKFEAERYSILNVLLKGKVISDLQLQVAFPIIVNDIKICSYIADFVYFQDGNRIVEDAKGVKTPEYKLKKKLMKATMGIDIYETFKNKK